MCVCVPRGAVGAELGSLSWAPLHGPCLSYAVSWEGVRAQLGMDRRQGDWPSWDPLSSWVKVCECLNAVGPWEEEERERRGGQKRGGRGDTPLPSNKDRRKGGKTAGQREERGEAGPGMCEKGGSEDTGNEGEKEEEAAGRGEGRVGGAGGCSQATLTVIKDIDVLRRQRVFAQVKGNLMLVMTPSPRPPCPLPAGPAGDLAGHQEVGAGDGETLTEDPRPRLPSPGSAQGWGGGAFQHRCPCSRPGCLASCPVFSHTCSPEAGWEGRALLAESWVPSGPPPSPSFSGWWGLTSL